jgi:HSP20 family protein
MGRDYARRFSTAMKHNEAIAHNASSSKAAADTTVNPVSSFFHDIDEFFPKPFFAGIPLLKQMDWIDDMRKHNYFPNYNIKTDGDNLILSVDLSGVTLDDVKVEVKDNKLLHISGGRKTEGDDDRPRCELRFDRNFEFGDAVDAKKVLAQMKDGVLRITMPKLPKPTLPHDNILQIDVTRHSWGGGGKNLNREELCAIS